MKIYRVLPTKCLSKKWFLGFDDHLQAYTNELELEVAHLHAENARLQRQQDQVNKHREVLVVLPFHSTHINISDPYSITPVSTNLKGNRQPPHYFQYLCFAHFFVR